MTAGANDKIRYASDTIYGSAAYMGRATGAHLDDTKAALARAHAGCHLEIIQGGFNTTVAASAGTHDFDGCLDVEIVGMPWDDAQRFLREHGWAAFVRYPPAFGWHIHMISLGCTGREGIYVPGQVADYYAHKTGLVGHYADNSWHPDDITATIFDYAASLKATERDTMPTIDELLNAKVGPNSTVKDALVASLDTGRALGKIRDASRERDLALADEVAKILAGEQDDATAKQLVRVRDKLLEDLGTKDTTPPRWEKKR